MILGREDVISLILVGVLIGLGVFVWKQVEKCSSYLDGED